MKLSKRASEWMIEHGFDPGSIDARGKHKDTALILASRQGEMELVKELLASGADMALTNMDETNALWAACVAGSQPIADLLLNQGIDIDHLNANGASVLMYAASTGKDAWVDYLLQHGANAALRSLDGFSALELASTVAVLRRLQQVEKLSLETSQVGC